MIQRCFEETWVWWSVAIWNRSDCASTHMPRLVKYFGLIVRTLTHKNQDILLKLYKTVVVWLRFNVPFQRRKVRDKVESYPLTQWRKASDIQCLKKTSHLWLAITLMHVNGFWYVLAEMLPIKWAIKRRFTTPPQITCASALCVKMGKHENHIFHSIGLCYTHNAPVRCLPQRKIVICDVSDSV